VPAVYRGVFKEKGGGNLERIVAIDPGTVQSAIIEWDGAQILNAEILMNNDLLWDLQSMHPCRLAIEQVRCYGMPMGATTIDTVFWSGRFVQAWTGEFFLLPRMAVKMHLCHTSRADDSNIRQALIDRFGKPSTKKKPNEIYNGYKISYDLWAAWGLAVTFLDCHNTEEGK